MTATVHKLRAGPLPQADQRRECRLSSDVICDLIQAGTHRRNALAANHTSTPAEREFARYDQREYARHDRSAQGKSWFWRAVIVAYAVAAAAIYYYLCNH